MLASRRRNRQVALKCGRGPPGSYSTAAWVEAIPATTQSGGGFILKWIASKHFGYCNVYSLPKLKGVYLKSQKHVDAERLKGATEQQARGGERRWNATAHSNVLTTYFSRDEE